jgi:hypothetical protein
MRYKSGKGEVMVFDDQFVIHLEKMRKEKGFYPSLRVLAETLGFKDDLSKKVTWGHVHRSLKRLAAAGRLSDEAMKVYATTQQENTNEKTGQKRSNGKKAGKGKRV